MEYRIKEYLGSFDIQAKGYEKKGILWWKRKKWAWYQANKFGGVSYFHHPCESFKTLKEAQNRVAEFKKGVIYHEA